MHRHSEGIIAMAGASALLSSIYKNKSKLTAEEQAERNKRREQAKLEDIRQAKVIKNICPNCDGKLVRGKKDKKNGYKRTWKCSECKTTQTI